MTLATTLMSIRSLGRSQDLDTLVQQAHQRGLKVILGLCAQPHVR